MTDRPRNTDPFAPWNNPLHRTDPFAPWNDPLKANNPFACWHTPFGSGQYRDEVDEKYGR